MGSLTSVITSTYNKSKYLDLTLAGFATQTDNNFELVIVNDGGTDETEEIINKYTKYINLKYVYQNNTGAAGARNKALELASGENIIIVDDDRIPAPEFISEHKLRLRTDSKVVSIGKQNRVVSFYTHKLALEYRQWMDLYKKYPQLVDCTEDIQLITSVDILENPLTTLKNHLIGSYDPAMLIPIVDKYGEDLSGFHFGWGRAFGGNMAFNRNHLNEKIVYDETYKGYGIEDTDLSYKLYEMNYKFVYTQNAVNFHQEHPRGILENSQHYKNLYKFCDKYDSLEVFLHKLDHEGEITLEEANAFVNIIHNYYDIILPMIHKFIKKVSAE
ncbi:glycosyltransferase [Paenibacillus xylaniclasticus]|uniref:glycosyltransferase n=1 Tax=Paenibacillus xylaniclasticus TaxID=588083 RepID=UPI000FDA7202|nr:MULTISPECIES: glycosyltransferase [Paenibacillus]GFN33177.1 putative glycosyltransferase YfnE [Paenibacillus curdlanolyticus]